MARQDETTAVLDVWQEAKDAGDDPIRVLLQGLLQRLLEEEMTAHLGAEPYERTAERRGRRNGYKPRTLKTRVGKMELLVPKDREGRFRTELFARYQRSEKALVLALVQMYLQGVSTRRVKRIAQELCGLEVSRSQVSALTAGLQAEVDAWRGRPLEVAYPYLVIDARYEKVRRRRHVVSQAVLTVVGVSAEGYREILGTYLGDSESEATWGEVFKDLKARGLAGVVYVVSDDHAGLVSAVQRYFQGAVWQRCQVHVVRNLLGKVSMKDRAWVLQGWRKVRDAETLAEAQGHLAAVVEALAERYPKVAAWLEEAGEEASAVYALPKAHRKQMRSTNMLERWHQEVKRRTRVVRIFPDGPSCLRLVTALSMETSEEWQGRRYLAMEASEGSAAGQPEPGAAGPAAARSVA